MASSLTHSIYPLYHPSLTHPPTHSYVPAGGGAALLHLSELLPAFRATLADEDERLGCDIVMKVGVARFFTTVYHIFVTLKGRRLCSLGVEGGGACWACGLDARRGRRGIHTCTCHTILTG